MRKSSVCSDSLRLRDLVPQARLSLGENVVITGCTSELARVKPGDLFACILDATGDGHLLATAAVERGAIAVLCEHVLPVEVPQVVVDDSREAFGRAAHLLNDNPSTALPVIGVAGTHGKTTSSLLIASVLNTARQGVAAITTLAHCDSIESYEATETTPRADRLAEVLAATNDNGASHAVVELSSQALAERRAAGLQLAAGVLTNLRRGQLDWHGSKESYRVALERMFRMLQPDAPLALNADDPASRELIEQVTNPVLTFGLHTFADVTATILERTPADQTFLLEAGSDSVPVCTKLIGDHNLYNCLSAATIGLLFGLDLATIARGLEAVEYIPGRMERVECGQDFSVYVDESTSHDSLAMCLKSARQVARGRVICVMSPPAKGEAQQRPLLGRVLEKHAQVAIITSERSKPENPLPIAHEVLDGFDNPGRARIIPSRDQAIRWALDEAREGDVVVVCGRGDHAWRLARKAVNDAAVIKQHLYNKAAEEEKRKSVVFAFSG